MTADRVQSHWGLRRPAWCRSSGARLQGLEKGRGNHQGTAFILRPKLHPHRPGCGDFLQELNRQVIRTASQACREMEESNGLLESYDPIERKHWREKARKPGRQQALERRRVETRASGPPLSTHARTHGVRWRSGFFSIASNPTLGLPQYHNSQYGGMFSSKTGQGTALARLISPFLIRPVTTRTTVGVGLRGLALTGLARTRL